MVNLPNYSLKISLSLNKYIMGPKKGLNEDFRLTFLYPQLVCRFSVVMLTLFWLWLG